MGKLHERKGCSLAKGIRMSIPSKKSNRASKPPEEEEGEDENEHREASSVVVDSNYEQVLPRVTSGRATAVLNTEGSNTTGRVS